MGQKKAPFYRIVVADSRSKRDGKCIEEIGTYDAPCINFTPYLYPYSFRLPDAMRGKRQVTILVRCAAETNAQHNNALVAATGTTRLGHIGIVEIK